MCSFLMAHGPSGNSGPNSERVDMKEVEAFAILPQGSTGKVAMTGAGQQLGALKGSTAPLSYPVSLIGLPTGCSRDVQLCTLCPAGGM